jgi:acyl-CoA thioester hydrolase
MPGPFRVKARVRMSETDAMGVVYYGQYYSYFDIARHEMLKDAGLGEHLGRGGSVGFVAAESSCRYRSSARFDDLLTLEVAVAKVGNSSVTYYNAVRKGKTLVAEGMVTDVLVDREGKPVKIPERVRAKLLGYGLPR